jgi:hypothetical protein
MALPAGDPDLLRHSAGKVIVQSPDPEFWQHHNANLLGCGPVPGASPAIVLPPAKRPAKRPAVGGLPPAKRLAKRPAKGSVACCIHGVGVGSGGAA